MRPKWKRACSLVTTSIPLDAAWAHCTLLSTRVFPHPWPTRWQTTSRRSAWCRSTPHETNQNWHTRHMRLQQVLWFESLPLDVALACCRLLHACRPSACAKQGALAHCLCRHTRSETERWPQAHKTASSRTPGERGDSRQYLSLHGTGTHVQWRTTKRCKRFHRPTGWHTTIGRSAWPRSTHTMRLLQQDRRASYSTSS